MPTDDELRAQIDSLGYTPWAGVVFRHLLGDTPPFRENQRGARWNPSGVPALYTSLDRVTCIAEVHYRVSLDVVKPTTERRLYMIDLTLDRLVDISHWEILKSLGFEREEIDCDDVDNCQRIGRAVAWLQNDGLLVPSLRAEGKNLIVFSQNCRSAPDFGIVRMEVLPPFE